MKRIIAIALAALTFVSLTACGRDIDKNATGAVKVTGTYNLWWFCDEIGTLIYFEDISSGDDDYVGMWAGYCENGKIIKNPETANSNNGGANG